MTISIVNQSYKGISELSIVRLNDNVVFNWPQPATFTVAPNITEKVQMTRNSLGEKVFAGSYTIAEASELTVSYEYITAEMVSFRLGNQLAAGSVDTKIPRVVTANQTQIAADATGGIYFGVALDAPTTGSVTRNGISTALTQTTVALFDEATDDTFAIGANGAISLADNLVAAREVLTFVIDVEGLAAASISDLLVGPIALRAKLVTSNNTVDLFEAKAAYINLGAANFDFGGEGNSDIAFRLSTPPGECRSYQVYTTNAVVRCA